MAFVLTMPSSVVPNSQTEILVRTQRTSTSDFTGFTQQINTLGEYWRGEFTLPPRRNYIGQPGETPLQQDSLRSFLAHLQCIDLESDGTFWLPMRIFANQDTFHGGSSLVSRIGTDTLELSDTNFQSHFDGLSTGNVVQVCLSEDFQISIVCTIGCINLGSGSQLSSITLTAPLPAEFLQNGTLKIIWGNVRLRVQITNPDAVSGVMSERNGVFQPAAIAWQEARGIILREADAVGAAGSVLHTEAGMPLTDEAGIMLRRERN